MFQTFSTIGLLLFLVLVWLGCLPVYYALEHRSGSMWDLYDWLGLAVCTLAIYMETTADWQLHRFRATRKRADEILAAGVWSWCRHPNYLGEISMWVGVALFAGSSAWRTWIGSAAMLLLFNFISIPLIEKRMEGKPGYEEHRTKRVRFSLLPLSNFLRT